MNNSQLDHIKDIIIKTGFKAESLKKGPTSIFITGKQFVLSTHRDKLIIKEYKKLFPKKYAIDLSEFG